MIYTLRVCTLPATKGLYTKQIARPGEAVRRPSRLVRSALKACHILTFICTFVAQLSHNSKNYNQSASQKPVYLLVPQVCCPIMSFSIRPAGMANGFGVGPRRAQQPARSTRACSSGSVNQQSGQPSTGYSRVRWYAVATGVMQVVTLLGCGVQGTLEARFLASLHSGREEQEGVRGGGKR